MGVWYELTTHSYFLPLHVAKLYRSQHPWILLHPQAKSYTAFCNKTWDANKKNPSNLFNKGLIDFMETARCPRTIVMIKISLAIKKYLLELFSSSWSPSAKSCCTLVSDTMPNLCFWGIFTIGILIGWGPLFSVSQFQCVEPNNTTHMAVYRLP